MAGNHFVQKWGISKSKNYDIVKKLYIIA